jgi:hypothetical protein
MRRINSQRLIALSQNSFDHFRRGGSIAGDFDHQYHSCSLGDHHNAHHRIMISRSAGLSEIKGGTHG